MKILTYQDFLSVRNDRNKRINFIHQLIEEHKDSDAYKKALEYEKYYDGENPTINKYEKIIYDMQGIAQKNMWTANHKIASSFFQFAVDQEISYLLRSGISFKGRNTKNKLGKFFDENIALIAQYARIHGRAYGFWNLNHLDFFKFTEFAPLYDEHTGILSAGVRFWQIDVSKPMNIVLYEIDGFTEYIYFNGKTEIKKSKRSYIQAIKKSEFSKKTRITDSKNYSSFPIIEMRNGEKGKSAMNGKKNTVDALDIILSGMVNNTDEGTLIYWVLKNCNAMDEIDDAKFIRNIAASHVAHVHGDENAQAVPQSVEAPVDSSETTVSQLEKRLYKDFQAFDYQGITAGNQTATAIKAAYIPLDMKCDKIETMVSIFINQLLEIIGIDDSPSYTRNKLLNTLEEVQMYIAAEPFTGNQYVTEKLLSLFGDIDRLSEILNKISTESLERINLNE